MKHNTARPLTFLIAFSLLLSALISSSCNNRENILLPPNLDPKDYVLSSHILVYSDHLIRSENDDSYLYLPKESIADHLIWYQDKVSLKRVDPMLDRDSLAVNSGSQSLSASYRVQILRNSESITLESTKDFATIYSNVKGNHSLNNASLLSLRYTLNAEPALCTGYGKNRAYFGIDGSGDFALTEMSANLRLDLQDKNKDIQALLYAPDTYLQIFIPSAFMDDMGDTEITIQNQASDAQNALLSGFYPNFAQATEMIEVKTQNNAQSSAVPILHYRVSSTSTENLLWLKLGESGLESWQSSQETWLLQDNRLVSFINGAGSYFLIETLQDQGYYSIDLGSGYRYIRLGDVWIDCSMAKLADTEMQIYPNASSTALQARYFGGKPYHLSGEAASYIINFVAQNQILESLPKQMWVEFGFAAILDNPAAYRLMLSVQMPHKDVLSYKTPASAYDEKHFSYQDGFVYSGINTSGLYTLGKISEDPSSHHIPCLKKELGLQTQRSTYYYKGSDNPPCSALDISYNPSFESSHPWLNALPYSFSGDTALIGIQPVSSSTDAIPEMFHIETSSSMNLQALVNFSTLSGYPKFVRYKRMKSLEHNSFVLENNILRISPAFAGVILDAAQLNHQNQYRDIRIYANMLFDDYDLELYLQADSTAPTGTMRVSQKASFDDPYQVFQDQYQLSMLSQVYDFRMLDNEQFFDSCQPYVRLKQNLRTDNLLFSVSNDDYYRIYSYPEADEADAWSFSHSEGHFAFYLPYKAQFGIVRDNQPHDSSSVTISKVSDIHLSLYQAQAVFPAEYIGNELPMGADLELKDVPSAGAGISSRNALQLSIWDVDQNPLQTDFYTSTVPEWPYLYLPIPDYNFGENIRLFYRDNAGQSREYSLVEEFSDFPNDEYRIIGNCALVFIDNPGIFYLQ